MQKVNVFRFYISLALAVIGIFTIFSPQNAMFAVVIILGVLLTLWGLVSIIRSFNRAPQSSRLFDENKKSSGNSFANNLLSFLLLAAGILLLVFSGQAKSVFIPIVIGFWALAAGVFATVNAINSYRNHQDYVLSIIALAVSFATAFALFAFSASIAGFTSPAGGVFLIIFGIITAIEISTFRSKALN